MGFLSKVWKGVKKIGSKIVGGINKIGDALTGGNWSKWMQKGWVQKALMAATLLTGGIAIVNGVMTGWGAAASTAGDFATKFVAGSKGFVKGLASGLANPVGEAKNLLGIGGDGLSAVTAQTGASINPATGQAVAPGLAEASASSGILESAGAAAPTSSPIQTMLSATNESQPMNFGQKFSEQWAGASGDLTNKAGFLENPQGYGSAMGGGGQSLNMDALSGALQKQDSGWLQSLKSGAKDFISSPMGMQTAASAVSGWAQGQALEEQWSRMDEERRRKRATWDGFASRAPRMEIPGLQSIRDRRQQMYDRGDEAQAKYGY